MKPDIQKIVDDVITNVVPNWSEEERNAFFLGPYVDEPFEKYHMNIGLWIRNHYNLWTYKWEPELIDGVDYSPYHPDQLSNTIIKAVWEQGRANGC